MKTQLAIIIGCVAIAFSAASFSWSKFDSCRDESGSGDDGYCTTCSCVDLGYGRNDCMSLSDYCEVFGNIGR